MLTGSSRFTLPQWEVSLGPRESSDVSTDFFMGNRYDLKNLLVFNERATKRSRSTSRFGFLFLDSCLSPLAHEQHRSNFKVELRWLPITELTKFFVSLRVCLLYVVDNVPHAPHARGHVHVPFYEGTCPTKSHFFMNNSGTTSKWKYDGIR